MVELPCVENLAYCTIEYNVVKQYSIQLRGCLVFRRTYPKCSECSLLTSFPCAPGRHVRFRLLKTFGAEEWRVNTESAAAKNRTSSRRAPRLSQHEPPVLNYYSTSTAPTAYAQCSSTFHNLLPLPRTEVSEAGSSSMAVHLGTCPIPLCRITKHLLTV